MSEVAIPVHNLNPPPARLLVPINPNYIKMDSEELEFFKQETGIHDDAALNAHILAVQDEAFKVYIRHRCLDMRHIYISMELNVQVYPYPCIRCFRFAKSVPLFFDSTQCSR